MSKKHASLSNNYSITVTQCNGSSQRITSLKFYPSHRPTYLPGCAHEQIKETTSLQTLYSYTISSVALTNRVPKMTK